MNFKNYLKYRLTTALWVNQNSKFIKKKDMANTYLKYIAYDLANGNGNKDFITKRRINHLYKECYKRSREDQDSFVHNLHMRADVIFTLHCNALYKFGYSNHKPKYIVDMEGNYILNK